MNRHEPRWRVAGALIDQVEPWLRRWLLDQGSLTERLVRAGGGCFRVRRLAQGFARPLPGEARALGLGHRRWALIREVVLFGRGQPWVFARSVLPLPTLSGRHRRLRNLPETSLGRVLFRDPGMGRGPIELARISPASRYVPAEWQAGAELWGRRSRFTLDQKPLLVSEVFLPDFDPLL